MTHSSLVTALLGPLFLYGCSFEPRAATVLPIDAGASCAGAVDRSLDELFTKYFSGSAPTGCATSNCHADPDGGALYFTNASEFWLATVGVASKNDPGMKLITPNDPDHSYLYRKLLPSADNRMPEDGPYLDAAALSEVAGWICQGAQRPTGTGPGDAGTSFELTAISPSFVLEGSGPALLTLDGIGFTATSVAKLDANALPTSFVSSSRLTASLDAATTATAGTHTLTVVDGAASTSALAFSVDNPLPVLSSVSPSPVATGGAPFTLTLTGTGFHASSRAFFDGAQVSTTFVSSTRLTFSVPTITAPRSIPVYVSNPSPGGGQSSTVDLVAQNMTGPSITGLSPNPAVENTAFTLVVSGAGYTCGANRSELLFNGSALPSSTCTSTALDVAILATAQGTYPVQVRNPGTGDTSLPVDLVLAQANPVPTLTSLAPDSGGSGQPGFTLVATGTQFISGAVLNFNGSPRTTTFVSGTEVSALIPSLDLTTLGTFPVTVTNPPPGGGASNAVGFTVLQSNPPASVTALSPCGAVAGGASFTLTIDGSFAPGATVSFGGVAVPVDTSSATQLTVTVPSSAITTAPADGSIPVIVTNPPPGGGASMAQTFGLASRAVTLAVDVQPIFNASCVGAGCHTTATTKVPMSLSSGQSYASVVGVTCTQCPPRLRVKACGPLPSQSYLMAKVLNMDVCFGTRMPKSAALSAADLQTLRDWIAQGAPP